jgi:hypothetical protein
MLKGACKEDDLKVRKDMIWRHDGSCNILRT